jgi:hypothetical protein
MFAILHQCNAALVAYLQSEGAGTDLDLWPAKHFLERKAPSTLVEASLCVEDPINSGIYKIQCAITAETMPMVDSAQTPGSALAASLERIHKIEQALAHDPQLLAERINQAAAAAGIPFYINGIVDRGREAGTNDSNTLYLDTIHLEIWGFYNPPE